MKKAGMLAMLLAGALVLGMGVGCGGNGNQGGTQQGGTQQGGTQQGGTEHTHAFAEGWTSDGEYHWHEATCGHAEAVTKEAHTFQNGECTVCGYYKIGKDTDVSAIVSDKLTEEEWKEALSEETLDNFLCCFSYAETVQDMSFAGKNFQSTLTVGGTLRQSMVFEYKDGKVYSYVQNGGGKWERTVLSEEVYRSELLPHVPGGLPEFLRSVKDKFEQTEYDGTLCAYLFTVEVDEPTQIALKFKNGRLCGFGLGVEGVYQYGVVYGYGEAQIVPPENYEEAN